MEAGSAKQELITSDRLPAVPEQPKLMGLMEMAVQAGMPPDSLERLFSLYEKDQAMKARTAFNEALQGFQGDCPAIIKDATAVVSSPRASYTYNYAKLDRIVGVVRPILMQHGLSFRFDSEVSADRVEVRCIVQHVQGHQEVTRFAIPIGGMAGSNAAQQTASALSYARRYALIMALGLVTTDDVDDDGLGGENYVSLKQLAALKDLVKRAEADVPKFLAIYKVPDLEHLPASRFKDAVEKLEHKIVANGGRV